MTSTIIGVSLAVKLAEDEVYCSFLPLSHAFDRVMQYFLLYHGAKIVYFSGDVLKLKDDWALIKPTFMAIVPRLLIRYIILLEYMVL